METGDVINVRISQKTRNFRPKTGDIITYESKEDKINNIFHWKGNLTAMCLLEREEGNILYVGGDKKLVFAFSINHREIIDIYTVSEKISTLECLL